VLELNAANQIMKL